jgi:hypothetical protein
LHEPDWRFDPDEAAAFNNRRKRSSSTRRTTDRQGLHARISRRSPPCRQDAIAISDEIYEHIIYDGNRHVPIATIEGMAEPVTSVEDLRRDRLAWAGPFRRRR